MRIVFIGASGFGLQCLQEITSLEECKVVGVITAPSEFKISYSKHKVRNFLHANYSEFCKNNSFACTVIQNGMNDSGLFEKVKEWRPDIFIVAGWYHMIPPKWLNYRNCYGLHASLLPDYSGGAPLVWAMINGEKKTGITLFQMDEGVDSGPILGQAEEVILEDDTIQTLYKRIEKHGIQLIKKCLPLLASGGIQLTYQDEKNRRIFPQRSPSDGLINLSWSHQEISNFIRAQTKPYPGAFLLSKKMGKKIIIWDCRMHSMDHEAEMGTVIEVAGEWGICCSNGVLTPLLVNHDGLDSVFDPAFYI
jgi:methionyl-tRNA formyltransferase